MVTQEDSCAGAESGRVSLPTTPLCSAPPIPLGPCPVCPRLDIEFEPWRQAAYWKSQHQRALQREAALQVEIDSLRAQLRLREQQLFGRKTEAGADTTPTPDRPHPKPKRPRGQQVGQPGPKRRDFSHLPAVEQTLDLPHEQQACAACGQPFAPFPGTEDSAILEVEVRAYRRVVHRRRYRPTCRCGRHPGIVTTPPPAKVIAKSILGLSILVELLLDKYLFYRPTYRLLQDFSTRGLDLALSTVTEDLHRLLPLLEPVYQALTQRNQQQHHWHADETRWMVFQSVEGKTGYRWYLWVFHSAEVVVFVLDAGRAHDVPETHLGPVAEGILSGDRYSAYKAIAAVKQGRILLAFCWAHVRRDFLQAARSWPEEEGWALSWVERIGQLYHANDQRLAVQQDPAAWAVADQTLRLQVEALRRQAEQELAVERPHPARQKVLTSLQQHWEGLTVFVDHPHVPLDNNRAERVQRGAVVGRKNYYGSGAEWSGQLAAMLFSLFQTLSLANLNPRLWLSAYLEGCAQRGGPTTAWAESLLPWNLSAEQKRAWSLKPEPPNTS
jgi:transposase